MFLFLVLWSKYDRRASYFPQRAGHFFLHEGNATLSLLSDLDEITALVIAIDVESWLVLLYLLHHAVDESILARMLRLMTSKCLQAQSLSVFLLHELIYLLLSYRIDRLVRVGRIWCYGVAPNIGAYMLIIWWGNERGCEEFSGLGAKRQEGAGSGG